MGFYMLKPHSFLTVLHSLLSLRFTPGAHQALSTWMQVHSSTEKLPKFTMEGYCSGAKVLQIPVPAYFMVAMWKTHSASGLNLKRGYKPSHTYKTTLRLAGRAADL